MGQGHKLRPRAISPARVSTLDRKCPGPLARPERRCQGPLIQPPESGCRQSHVSVHRTLPSNSDIPEGRLGPTGASV